jgi:hypothetical protein
MAGTGGLTLVPRSEYSARRAAPDAFILSREAMRSTPKTLTCDRFSVGGWAPTEQVDGSGYPDVRGAVAEGGAYRRTTEPAPSTCSGLVRGFLSVAPNCGIRVGLGQGASRCRLFQSLERSVVGVYPESPMPVLHIGDSAFHCVPLEIHSSGPILERGDNHALPHP